MTSYMKERQIQPRVPATFEQNGWRITMQRQVRAAQNTSRAVLFAFLGIVLALAVLAILVVVFA
jgi:hypothetical protein